MSDAAAAHLQRLPRCQARAATVHRALDAVRTEADAAADAAFSAADLDRQQRAIAARIARSHRAARVLPFPGHESGLAVRTGPIAAGWPSPPRPGWCSAHWPDSFRIWSDAVRPSHGPGVAASAAAPAVVAARADTRPLEDTLLSEVDAALDADARPELRALDALTPVHYEIR